MLTRYFATARAQIEAHGGVVEKFIGDAVVGVFGVPAAHEDDPERAVRAALRIADGRRGAAGPAGRAAPAADRHQHRRGARPARHRARSRGAVPRRRRDQHRVADPVGRPGDGRRGRPGDLRGHDGASSSTRSSNRPRSRARPSRSGSSIRSRHGPGWASTSRGRRRRHSSAGRRSSDVSPTSSTRPSSSRAVRFAAIVGEPGIGKSRLVAELLAYVDAQPMLVTWRQGRCLPYGAGIAFWALGEIVKAHAGILESDPTTVAIDKLERVLPAAADHAWLVRAAAAADRHRVREPRRA